MEIHEFTLHYWVLNQLPCSLQILMIRLSSLSCLDCSDYFSWLEILHNHFQELLLQPLAQFMSDQGDCLEGSPFLSSLSDGEAYGVRSSHLQRQSIFLLLDCSVNLISQTGSMENQSDCSTLSSLFTNNPDTELDHLRRKKGLLELYKWIQNHLPNEVSINYETHSEICINFMSSFLQLYLHEVCLITLFLMFLHISLWVWILSDTAIVFKTVFDSENLAFKRSGVIWMFDKDDDSDMSCWVILYWKLWSMKTF